MHVILRNPPEKIVGMSGENIVAHYSWDETALVLTSDHTVRELWTQQPLFLSPSLRQAIESLRERTVPFLVKLPRQTRAFSYSEPFNAVVVHGVVRALLREEFKKPEEVLDYIRRNADGAPCPASASSEGET